VQSISDKLFKEIPHSEDVFYSSMDQMVRTNMGFIDPCFARKHAGLNPSDVVKLQGTPNYWTKYHQCYGDYQPIQRYFSPHSIRRHFVSS